MQRSTLALPEGERVPSELEQAILDHGGRITGTMQVIHHELRYPGSVTQLRKELDELVAAKALKPVEPPESKEVDVSGDEQAESKSKDGTAIRTFCFEHALYHKL